MIVCDHIVFGVPVSLDLVKYRGIEDITAADVEATACLGYQLKLVARAERVADVIEVWVEPSAMRVVRRTAG